MPVELMSWRIVPRACMRALTFSFKRLLLPNHLANLVETSWEASSQCPVLNPFEILVSMATGKKNSENLKNLLLQKCQADFQIIV